MTETASSASCRPRAGPARARRAAVGDPPVLRHPRDHGRRHQPRRRRARLRHATRDRRGRRRVAPRGAHALHLELRHARAAAGALRAPRAALRRPLRPGDGDPHHGRGVGGGRPRPARDVRPGRRGDPPRALVRGLRPGDRLRRRDRPPRGDALRGRLRARPGGRRGRDHAAHQGALPRLSVQPDRGRPAARDPGRAGRHRGPSRPARLQRRDLRPAGLRDVHPSRDERAAGDARADDPDGRLLEGVRDDRLARRLRGGARRRSSRASSRSTSTGSCRRRRWPRTPRWWPSSRASRTSSGCAPSTTAAAG